MHFPGKTLLAGCVLSLSILAAGCSNQITEEQLAQINELRKHEAQLKDEVRKKEEELSRLRSEVDARQKELDNCLEMKAFVEEKLKNWPNVWPDYDPNAPTTDENTDTK